MITVVNDSEQILEATYEKRARQLVKKGRAYWINDGMICLLEPTDVMMDRCVGKTGAKHEEAKCAMDSIYEESQPNGGYRVVDPKESFEIGRFYNEEQLFKLAKKKLAEKRALTLHIASYAVVNTFLFLFFAAMVVAGEMNGGEMVVVFISTAGGWGIGLVLHIVTYFTRATPEKIEREYQKLKELARKM